MASVPYCQQEEALIAEMWGQGYTGQEVADASNAKWRRGRTRSSIIAYAARKKLVQGQRVSSTPKPRGGRVKGSPVKIEKRPKGRPEKGAGVVWTAEMDAVIVQMWNDNQSTLRMSKAMKAQFGQVMSEWTIERYIRENMARLGIQDREDLRKRNGRIPRSKKGLKPPTKAKAVDRTQIDGTPFDQLAKGQCRFPLTDSLPHLFCKSSREHESPYCSHHLAICNPEHPAINPNPKPKKEIRA